MHKSKSDKRKNNSETCDRNQNDIHFKYKNCLISDTVTFSTKQTFYLIQNADIKKFLDDIILVNLE